MEVRRPILLLFKDSGLGTLQDIISKWTRKEWMLGEGRNNRSTPRDRQRDNMDGGVGNWWMKITADRTQQRQLENNDEYVKITPTVTSFAGTLKFLKQSYKYVFLETNMFLHELFSVFVYKQII